MSSPAVAWLDAFLSVFTGPDVREPFGNLPRPRWGFTLDTGGFAREA